MPGGIASKTYGTVSADRQKEMSGLEFVRGLVDGTLPLNTIAQTLGYDVSEVERGRVVITAEPSNLHLNPAGTVHGGFTATLLDSCMGLAVQSTLEKGIGQTTLEFKISLVRPITPETGTIRAEGVVLNCGRRVGTAEGRVTDARGRLLAHGTTTCLIFGST
ncbi:PaaI family thioesterase [Bradyrhizobium prioriisuperbiae]|uniref:PaaI family thioesterase n=1 Tax=Bradyrhizobium prioriisuperbiae TaxID=2854389 RepID=UPI0028EA65BF|nr:PaaI family thioesterase [Bradyrhizobium prioritasuperba]